AALARLPGWETYARRLGRSDVTDYAAALRMRNLFDIPFMRRSNPEAGERITSLCDRLLAGMSEVDRRAVERWRGLDRPGGPPLPPITAVVAYERMIARDFAGAALLFEEARRSVSEISFSRLQSTWYLVQCRRRLSPTMTPEDLRLVEDAVEGGERLRRFEG